MDMQPAYLVLIQKQDIMFSEPRDKSALNDPLKCASLILMEKSPSHCTCLAPEPFLGGDSFFLRHPGMSLA